ncbi:MAG: DUF151 domain-containing protein [Desulfurococcales archaeon]|nr:DUF151 domain-containing protein [Desulfurococcales archaeon]MEB3779827.1 DUF151 domain-containing protein [Desulfurococcales archaeon]
MTDKRLIRAVEIMPFTKIIRYEDMDIGTYLIGLNLRLEDGRVFTLVNIPYEVAEAIKLYNHGEPPPRRQSLFSLLMNHEEFIDAVARTLKRVVVDELDRETNLYTATVEFSEDGLSLNVKMIPSHAIYLALITGKPVYVAEDLVEQFSGEEEEYEIDDEEEEY